MYLNEEIMTIEYRMEAEKSNLSDPYLLPNFKMVTD